MNADKHSGFQIVFVASNFVSEHGDMAILDDIQIIYESDGDECGAEQEEAKPKSVEKTSEATEEGTSGRPNPTAFKEVPIDSSYFNS